MKAADKIFGEFPDGFRMNYADLLDTLLTTDEKLSGTDVGDSIMMKKLVAAHGGYPKMYFSEGGIQA